MRHPEQVLEALEKGRNYIDRSWIKGSMFERRSWFRPLSAPEESWSVCAMGAVSMGTHGAPGSVLRRDASQNSSQRRQVYTEAMSMLKDCLPPGQVSVPGFNDNKNTTKQDVLKMFDMAICRTKKEIAKNDPPKESGNA